MPAGRKQLPRFEDVLPFTSLQTAAGPISLRRVIKGDHECVGSVALGGVAAADASSLSLLALTPELAQVDLTRALYVDTETTGLGGGTGNYAFLVGLCYRLERSWVLEQLVLRDPDDEPALLSYLRGRFEQAELIVSYNGKSFDLPLLRTRYLMQQQPAPPCRPHLDLLHLARRIHAHRSFRKNLITVEREVLGFHRGPDIAGEEVAARYRQYLRQGDPRLLRDTVTHNAYDVLSLVALTALYGEPLSCSAVSSSLGAMELASAARVMKRAGDLDRAWSIAELAVMRGAGADGLRVRAEVAKARGDRHQAIADFEALLQQVSDSDARLELSKLYEHHLHAPARALALAQQGTGEGDEAHARRCRRLQRKLGKTTANDHADVAVASSSRLG